MVPIRSRFLVMVLREMRLCRQRVNFLPQSMYAEGSTMSYGLEDHWTLHALAAKAWPL